MPYRISAYGFTDMQNWTDLHYAVFYANLPEIDRQIKDGENIDVRNGDGRTPLFISILSNSKCIKAVLKHNPSMNLLDRNKNYTPLLMFVRLCTHTTSTLKLMLEMGADPNLSNIDGNGPLHIIAEAYRKSTLALKYAQILIKFGSNINAQNNCGDTPLHVAIKSGFTRLIKILFSEGANIKIRNCAGKNPIDFVLHYKGKSSEIFMEFGRYIIKQTRIEKLFVNENVLNTFCESSDLKHFKKLCDEEVSKLKSSVSDEIFVTYYDLLVSPSDVVTKYLRNETLKYVLALDEKGYIYGHELRKIIQDSTSRNKALEIGYKFFKKYSPVILPDLCLDSICNHLTNKDLLKLKNFTC